MYVGGSGGSLNLACGRFVGLGVLSVNGGAGRGTCGTGAGAGRLAVTSMSNTYAGRYEAYGMACRVKVLANL
jgi:hypothetical protein